MASPAAQAQEQFVPLLVYRTGQFAPLGIPWADGKQDYLKLVNAKGGINGVKIKFEECETAYDTAKGVECYERLKNKDGGASGFDTQSTGITFAVTDKAPGDKMPIVTMGYGLSQICYQLLQANRCLALHNIKNRVLIFSLYCSSLIAPWHFQYFLYCNIPCIHNEAQDSLCHLNAHKK